MTLSRRAALRMGGGLGLGGLLAGGRVAQATPSLVPGGVPNSGNPSPTSGAANKNWGLYNDFEQDHVEWRRLPDAMLDPDLCGMRSLSPSIRRIIQRQRNIDNRDTLLYLRKRLGLS